MLLASTDHAHSMLLTMAAAIAIGVMLIVAARRFNVPVIVVLLLGGVAAGPAGFGVIDPSVLGDGLQVIVALAVGLILFEGGLTLDLTGYRSAPTMIKRLLTIGVLVTWFGTAAAVWLLCGVGMTQAIIAGSLVIVTGPTVVAPLLKRIRIRAKLHGILHWEGVLIDPIGVFIALLCFEWVSQADGGQTAVLLLFGRVAWGLAVGILGGLAIGFLVKRKIVPEDLTNVFALGFAVLIFAIADAVISEAGLLAVTVAGFVFGLSGRTELKEVKQFKADITDLLIGTLFILLAARLDLDQFAAFGVTGALAVAAVMLIVRPAGIFLCSLGLDLEGREKAFLAWVAPRGIVAASMASLVAIRLEAIGTFESPRFVETFAYSVIIATIVLQGLTAGPLAAALGLRRPDPRGWLVVGAHAFAQRVAGFLQRTAEVPVVLVDTNARAVRRARGEDLNAIVADARDIAIADRLELQGVGNVLALTDNEDLNVRVCDVWDDLLGRDRVYRWSPAGVDPSLDDQKAEQPAGIAVWPMLPRPTIIAGELVRSEAALFVSGRDDPDLNRAATPLLVVNEDRVEMVASIDAGEPAGGADPPSAEATRSTLFIRRAADYLERSLRAELIADLEAETLRSLFDQLIERVVAVHQEIPREATVGELVDSEAVFPTALGHGVAVPHAYTRTLTTRLCAIARLPAGIDWDAPDGVPVRLVFLILSPQGDPEGHLATLAEVARVVGRESTRDRLLEAHAPGEIIRIVNEAARR